MKRKTLSETFSLTEEVDGKKVALKTTVHHDTGQVLHQTNEAHGMLNGTVEHNRALIAMLTAANDAAAECIATVKSQDQ